MYILLTSLLALTGRFSDYRHAFEITVEEPIGSPSEGFRALSHSLPGESFLRSVWVQSNGVSIGCSYSPHDSDNAVSDSKSMAHRHATSALQQYMDFADTEGGINNWTFNFAALSCVIHDPIRSLVLGFADAAGSIPLWYHLLTIEGSAHSHITVSTDLLAVLSLELMQVSVLSPGMVMGIDLADGDILFMRHWSSLMERGHPSESISLQPMAFRLLERVFASIATVGNGTMIELDVSEPCSQLLSCAAEGLGLHRAVYVAPPLVSERQTTIPVLEKILCKYLVI